MAGTTLSPRETTVLHLIAWGYSNKAIATRLSLSVKTVEAHKANGMRKLNFTSRVDLVRHAVCEGWLKLDEGVASSSPSDSDFEGKPPR